MSGNVNDEHTVKNPLGKYAAYVLCAWMALQLIGLFIAICLLWPRVLPAPTGAPARVPALAPAALSAPALVADLAPGDLVDEGTKLLGHLKTATGSLARYLLAVPPPSFSESVTAWDATTPPSAPLKADLLKRLNTALNEAQLSTKADAQVVTQTADPKEPNPKGEALRRRNRSLLEASFKDSFVIRPVKEPSPGAAPTTDQGSTKTDDKNSAKATEGDLLLVVLLFGALGGACSATWTTTAFIGGRRMEESWVLWNLLRAPIGGALAAIYYCVSRGGILAADAPVDKINVFFITGTAGLVGLFTKVAMQKLQQAFGGKAPPTQSDTLASLSMPVITQVDPPALLRTAGITTVKLTGTGFLKNSGVLIDGAPQKVTATTPIEIQVAVDPQTLTIGRKTVIVITPSKGGELHSKPSELTIS
jgi:hypothetical protein